MDTFDLYMAISHKLGWDNMLSHIAIPAIKQIVDNYTLPKCYLLELDGNNLFGLLIGECTVHDWNMFVSLRGEIEYEMFHGITHPEAIDEWFK